MFEPDLPGSSEGAESHESSLEQPAGGAMASDGRRTARQSTSPAEGVGRLGAGDAFSAGFLFGWLQNWEIERSLQWANAAARHKFSTPGDLPWFTANELDRSLDQESGNRLIR